MTQVDIIKFKRFNEEMQSICSFANSLLQTKYEAAELKTLHCMHSMKSVSPLFAQHFIVFETVIIYIN